MMARGVIPFAGQGFVGGPTTNATPLGGVGGVDWSIDGATNSGVNRQMSTSPNTDMVQEMRVESTNFTANIGHGTGVGISMMTKAGTNTPRGTVNYQYWTNKFNPPNRFQQVVFDRDPRAGDAYEDGASNNLSLTFGGPVHIPGIINGTNKFFMFANYSYGHDDFNGKSASPNRTLPRSDPGHNHLAGDFSDLLLLPNPAQYQIYDPLTTRPDPARPGHVIRDPFPNNIIPADRITNPLYKQYVGFLPAPNTQSDGVESAAHQQLLRHRPAGSTEKPRLWRASRLQPLGPKSVLRARQRQQLHRRRRGLDVRERARAARIVAGAKNAGRHRDLDSRLG